mgnify:CR=1 FL=1
MTSGKLRLPEIRIKYAWLLSNAASVPMNELYGKGEPLLDAEEYFKIADRYKKAWKPYEKKILKGMCDLFGLEFRQNIIDVSIAPWFRAFSDPMVIGVIFSDEEFVVCLTHELLHRLLTDNTKLDYDIDLVEPWRQMYGKQYSHITLVHIPVHAGVKAILLDVLNRPDLLKKEIDNSKDSAGYKEAWEYVEKNDYNEIIKKLREEVYKNDAV